MQKTLISILEVILIAIVFYSCSNSSNPVTNNQNTNDTLIFQLDSLSRRGQLTYDTTIDTSIKKVKISYFLTTDDGTFDTLVYAGFTIDNNPPISFITYGYLCNAYFENVYNLSEGIYPRNIHLYIGFKPGTYFYIKMYKIKVYKTQ